MTAAGPLWKGLDTSRMPVFLGYDQIERMVASLLNQAARWRPDAVVGIARGGIVPAAMASGILALKLAFLSHDQAVGKVAWIGPPAPGQRILLVDDCCSSGETLARARAFLLAEGRECLTLVVVHDPDVVRHKPDLSHPMRALFRLPWERGEATPTGRAAKRSGAVRDHDAEAPFTGIGFDAADLDRLPPPVPLDRAVLIGDFADADRPRLTAALAARGWRDVPLCGVGESPTDTAATARAKAEAASRFGCTHFIECDAAQSIGIAGHAPHLIVTWWSRADGRGWTIGAAAHPPAPVSPLPEPGG